MTKKNTKKWLSIVGATVLTATTVGSLAVTLSSCTASDIMLPSPTPAPGISDSPTTNPGSSPIVKPTLPDNGLVPMSKLMFSDTNNDYKQLKAFKAPNQVTLDNFIAQKSNAQTPVLVTKDFATSNAQYQDILTRFQQDATLLPSIINGMTSTYVKKIATANKINSADVMVNLISTPDQKQYKVAVQFSNNTDATFDKEGLKLKPHEYYAFQVLFDYSNASFSLNADNQLVLNNVSMVSKNDVNGMAGKFSSVSSIYPINNNPNLLNVQLKNISDTKSPTKLASQWFQTNFQTPDQDQTILTGIQQYINSQYTLYSNVFDAAQTIGTLIANNVTIKDFLNGIGAPLADILAQYQVTAPFAELVSVMFSPEGNFKNIQSAMGELMDSQAVDSTVGTILQGALAVLGQGMGDQTLVDYILSIPYDEVHQLLNDLVQQLGAQLPANIKTIINIVDTYCGLVNQVAVNAGMSIGELGILQPLTDESIKAQVPNFLDQIKPIIPARFGQLIDLIKLVWNQMSPNWTLVNLQGIILNILNPTYQGQATTLNQLVKTGIDFIYNPGNITRNPDQSTFNLNQEVQIQFKDNVNFDLSPLKNIFSGVKLLPILKYLQVDLHGFDFAVKSITIGKLIPKQFVVMKGEGINVVFNDDHAMLTPTATGYNIIADQYVVVNFKNSFKAFEKGVTGNFPIIIAFIADIIVTPYISSLTDYYMGYPFGIDSPIYVEDANLALNLDNVYDGSNSFVVNQDLVDQLQTTVIPSYIANHIQSLTNKQDMKILPDATLTQSIKEALGLTNFNDDQIHMEINLTPAFSKDASNKVAPAISKAWVSVYFDQPLLNTTMVNNSPLNTWTTHYGFNHLNIANINNPVK